MFRLILSCENATILGLIHRAKKRNSCLKQSTVTSLLSRRESKIFYSNSINNNELLKSQLEKLSKTDLIEMILQKDNPLNKSQLEESKYMVHLEESQPHTKAFKEGKEFRGPPEINWAETCQRHIALKVSYLGWNYAGFASQGVNSMALPLNRLNFKKGLRMRHPQNRNQTMVATVEDYLFEALERCSLIENARTIVSTRSGRTDKGVSGLCQIITVKVRSVLPKHVLAANPDAVEGEKPFLEMINRFLPQDIRVIGWAPVPETFNARYDCTSRKYKYLFTLEGSGLDVERMKEACEHLVGTHDFRNLSRMDGSKQRVVFTRHIFSACIQPASLGYAATEAQTGELGSPQIYELFIHGSSFLWHQMRCIMVVLFRVGQGLEDPSVVPQLLDVVNLNSKPAYEPASPFPLFLYETSYAIPFKWQTSGVLDHKALARVYRRAYASWYEHIIKCYYYSNLLQTLDKDFPDGGIGFLRNVERHHTSLVMGAGNDTHIRKYTPLLKAQRSASIEILNERFRQRKLRRTQKGDATEISQSGICQPIQETTP